MRELHDENITKSIIKEIQDDCRFVQEPNWSNYDYITVDGSYIEIFKEETLNTPSRRRNFKKDSISGVYVEF